MGIFNVRIESEDDEVIEKFLTHFPEQVTERGKGMVSAESKVIDDNIVMVTMNYRALGLRAFRKVVFPQIKKTVHKKDKNAKVELLDEEGKKPEKKPSLIDRLFRRGKKPRYEQSGQDKGRA